MKVRLAPHFRKFENKKRLIFKIVRVSAHHKLLTPTSYLLTLNQHSIMLNFKFFHCFVLALCQAMPYLLQ